MILTRESEYSCNPRLDLSEYALAPSRLSLRSLLRGRLLRTTIGIEAVCGVDRKDRRTSRPDNFGSKVSKSTRSGAVCAATRNASSPSQALTMLQPARTNVLSVVNRKNRTVLDRRNRLHAQPQGSYVHLACHIVRSANSLSTSCLDSLKPRIVSGPIGNVRK